MKKESYVYTHTRLDSNEIFYIGIGRIKNYKRAYQKRHRSIFWHNIVNKTSYEVKIIADNLSWREACDLEMFLVNGIGRKDLGLGPLVNMTDGGDGNIGMTQSQKQKISNSLKGKKQSVETKLKRVQTLKEVWKNQELRDLKRKQSLELHRLGIICKKGKISPLRGIKLEQERKDKISEKLLEYYKTNKPHNFKDIEVEIQEQIIDDFESGVNRFQLHKKYNLNRKIIDRIVKK